MAYSVCSSGSKKGGSSCGKAEKGRKFPQKGSFAKRYSHLPGKKIISLSHVLGEWERKKEINEE